MDEEIELTTVDGQTVRVALSGAVAAVGVAIQHGTYIVSLNQRESVEVRRVRDGGEAAQANAPPWNTCPKCEEVIGFDEVSDGGEVHCISCGAYLIAEAYTDGSWALRNPDDDREELRDKAQDVRLIIKPDADPAEVLAACARLLDIDPSLPMQGDRAEALIKAIRAITVEMPDDQPNGEAEMQLLHMEEILGRLSRKTAGDERVNRHVRGACGAMAKLCTALADDTKALREAAEAYFGGDFSKPAAPAEETKADEPDPLDPATPEAVVEEQSRALGLDPDDLRRRGAEFARSLMAGRGAS